MIKPTLGTSKIMDDSQKLNSFREICNFVGQFGFKNIPPPKKKEEMK
jgi:hypothetical protein